MGRKSVSRAFGVRARVAARSGRVVAKRLGRIVAPTGGFGQVAPRSGRAVAKRRLGAGLALALAASLVVGVGAPPVSAQIGFNSDLGPSVRIWARKLASTNVQFGMSVRWTGIEGHAGSPRETTRTANVNLTNSYFLYESNQVGAWYYSEWKVVGESSVGLTAIQSLDDPIPVANTVARVRARKLASGNVEFGLEFRGLGAVGMKDRRVWIPRARYLTYQAISENVVLYSSDFNFRFSDQTSFNDLDDSSQASKAQRCLGGLAVSDPQNNLDLADDCETLLASKSTLVLPDNASFLRSWSAGDRIGNWLGVRIDRISGRVESLMFGRQDALPGAKDDPALDGSLPPHLDALAGLKHLDLDHPRNDLTGSIPAELGNLTNLMQLKLSRSSLTGNIPTELKNLTNLEQLLLDGNSLTGNIPTWLESLTSLKRLHLSNNRLSGEIPTELKHLTNLEQLSLDGNSLTGNIPTELEDLTNLEHLDLKSNRLDGNIPAWLKDLTDLKRLYLDRNSLDGNIPTELEDLTNLQHLYLGNNSLTGNIPTELGNLSNLVHLSLENNNLDGSIPKQLGSLTKLKRLNLERNDLNGSIPPELGNLSAIQELYMGNNNLSGSIPSQLGNLSATLQSIKFYDSISLPTDTPAADDNSGLRGCVPRSLEGGTITVFRGQRQFCTS